MNAAAEGAGMLDVTLGKLVEAVASVTKDDTELVTVVTHMLRTRRTTWVGPTWAGQRVVVTARKQAAGSVP